MFGGKREEVRGKKSPMSQFATEVKLFGKWSYEDVEVRRATASAARMSTLTRERFI